MNFSYQMKPFDIKINNFGGQNQHQQHLSLSTLKFSNFSLSSLKLRTKKNNKNELLHQN
jgi:hypothetical protein